jgi:hypothetical protein
MHQHCALLHLVDCCIIVALAYSPFYQVSLIKFLYFCGIGRLDGGGSREMPGKDWPTIQGNNEMVYGGGEFCGSRLIRHRYPVLNEYQARIRYQASILLDCTWTSPVPYSMKN